MTRFAFTPAQRLAVTATATLAFSLSLSVSHPAMAACTGSINPAGQATSSASVLCNGADGNVTNSDSSTYKDTQSVTLSGSTAGSNTVIQFDGHGRVLTNSGSIVNDRVITGGTGARARTAVTMGASTQNAGNGTTYTAPVYDSVANTTKVTLSGTTVTNAYVGQSVVFGRYDAADADFSPATAYVITGVSGNTITIAGKLPPDYSGTGSLPERYSIVSNFGATTTVNGVAYNNVIKNSGTISASIGASEINANKTGSSPTQTSISNTSNVRAINTSVAGTYLVQNDTGGKILATHAGIGLVQAVFEGGQVLSMQIDNAGTIAIERQAPLSLTSASATGNPTGTSSALPGFSAQTIGNSWTIATEEEAEEIKINNAAGGVIRSTGDYTGSFYSRVEEASIVNRGTIEHLSSAGDYSKGFAIGQVSNAGGVRELEVENYGTIHGDILSVNGNATRWHLLSTEGVVSTSGGVTTANLAAGLDDRLTINSHTGQANSEIENKSSGTIIGNFWYSNGKHELENEGTITGNIDVDQRDTVYANGANVGSSLVALAGSDEDIDDTTGKPKASNNTAQGTNYTIRGDKSFSFENEGKFTGNLSIRNATSSIANAAYGTETINKTVSSDNSIENSGTFDGNVTIADVAGAKNEISLKGDGFGRKADGSVGSNGLIQATNGTANNILNLDGQGTLRNSVLNFTTLNLLAGSPVSGGDDEDEDDDDGENANSGANAWTLAAGKAFQFQNVNILGGTLNVRGNLFGNTNIAADGILTGRGTITGDVANHGTVDVDDDTLHVTGNAVFHAGSKLATVIADDENGQLAVTGSTSFNEGSEVEARIDGARVRNGDTFKIVATGGGVVGLPEVEDSSALLRWTPIVDGSDLYITADIDSANISGLSRPATAAINGLLASDNELGNDVLMIESDAGVRKAGAQLAPETNFAKQQLAVTLNQVFGQHIDARLASVGATGSNGNFAQPYGLGMKQGDSARSNLGGTSSIDMDVDPAVSGALWARAFGSGLNQGAKDGVDGYDAKLYGVLGGYDNWISPGARLGIAVGYANARIDGEGLTAQNNSDINSYLAEIYGTLKGAGWYATGRTGYTWHDYDTTRVLTVPISDEAKGDYSGNQFNAALELGAPLQVGSGAVLTPIASLTYSKLRQDAYTETSDGGMALAIDSQTNDSLVSGLGLKALVPIAAQTVIEARAIWLHEFSDTAADVTASFASGGGTFTAAGPDVGRDSAQLGIGMMATISASSTFQLNYDATLRNDFQAHVGSAQLTVHY